MIKCRIHIESEWWFMDRDVFVEITLPCIPQIGSTLYMTGEMMSELEKMAKANLEIAARYAPRWFYYKSYNCKEPREENLEDLNFDDAITVKSIAFNANCDYVDIELGD